MYEHFDRKTAPIVDRIAFVLSEIIDEKAPLNWTQYRFAAECIAKNDDLMEDLMRLNMKNKFKPIREFK